MKDKLIEEILSLHCEHCHGKTFNCTGCNKEEQIKGILEKYSEPIEEKEIEIIEEQIEKTGVEVIEEPVEVVKETKKNKKK